jgi:imidazoleglycerol-phosphate dehydratase/histidinol-phosphatase
MQKILFLDRDGCIIQEPQPDQQVDSLEKLEFLPGAIFALARIARELDFLLVMVTNQDGLGTSSFPEETFWPAHQKVIKTLENEGVVFHNIYIDRSFRHENLPTRKPGTAMLSEYLQGDFDLANSYVIGDRLTDMQLAKNLGTRGILIQNSSGIKAESTPGLTLQHASGIEYNPEGQSLDIELIAQDWEQIYLHLKLPPRKVQHRRTTRETDIRIELNLDGTGIGDIRTGLGFYDHMLDQLARHGSFDLKIETRGDLHIDEHHSIEDTALALGEAFAMALGNKGGIERYGFIPENGFAGLPMDDALAQVAVDFGGRPWLVWDATFRRERIGEMPTEMFLHFFKSFSDAARCNLNIRAEGENEHHKIEAIYKAFAKALKMSVKRDLHNRELPTTKGVL